LRGGVSITKQEFRDRFYELVQYEEGRAKVSELDFFNRLDELYQNAPEEFSADGFMLNPLKVSDLRNLLDYLQRESWLDAKIKHGVSKMVEVPAICPADGDAVLFWKCITVELKPPIYEFVNHCSDFRIMPDPTTGDTVLIRFSIPNVFVPLPDPE